MNNKFKLFDVRWVSHTAGPSPVFNSYGPNCRTELFFMGCEKARQGNPCPDCFNPDLWEDIAGARELDPYEAVKHIEQHAPQKYITLVGGEPLDQLKPLSTLCSLLHNKGFHIILFTHYTMEEMLKGETDNYTDTEDMLTLHKSCDIIIDGVYDPSERIYDESWCDGSKDAIGSGNQVVWDMQEKRGIAARDIAGLYLNYDNVLRFITKQSVPWIELTDIVNANNKKGNDNI